LLSKGFKPPSLSEVELKKLLLEAINAADNPQDLETYHAIYDHPERGLTTDDSIHCIEGNWTYGRAPEWNPDEWQWKYGLYGESVDGDEITVVVAVDTANRMFDIVTRWRE
jgi:hypothetical protein